MSACLHLIPCPLSGANLDQLSPQSIEAARSLHAFVAEKAKTARHFLKAISHPRPLAEIQVYEIPRGEDSTFVKEMIGMLKNGTSLGLVSEAGMPCIADPGYELVLSAHREGIEIRPYAGPNSMTMALMASGLPAQEFCFHGYLPAKKDSLRNAVIRVAEQLKKSGVTQLFMEAPYRNKQVFEILKHNVSPDLILVVAASLGTEEQIISHAKLRDWNNPMIEKFYDKPSIFILGKLPGDIETKRK